jgi:uncharacterized protein (DUF934 family)
MAQLLTTQGIQPDTWQTLAADLDQPAETLALPAGDAIYPLAIWQARKTEIIARGHRIGLLLQPDEAVEDITGDLVHFSLIAINFPKLVDGRGYSTASLLRQRHGYQGELRAVGDVQHDQLFFLRRVGFDSYALPDGKDAAHALAAGFTPFSDVYQAATAQPLPYVRRRA